ncbi:cell division protein ZapA [Sphingomonas pokkalii]|uniref:Cell division protein ZapA n=1 Tax=Sphingomonas pokkalii TaxID=2175090 RepID=A0A2U0SGX2_9SPHN|nr:cell division protein ZapA [Sphingomonas pokkalii]PVX30555.1 cell division protein ZapA [Sphingomonas pokkalii]
MAEITLQIAGRSYSVSAREEDEPHLRHIENRIARHAETAHRAAGGLGSERTLLYLVLILADALDEAEARPKDDLSPMLLERIADRLEAVALALEESAATS